MEYLIWEKVDRWSGAFSMVRLNEMRTKINCSKFPFCARAPRTPHVVTEDEVQAAVIAGNLFQNRTDTDVDKVLAVMAAVLSWWQLDVPSPRPLEFEQVLGLDPPPPPSWPAGSVELIKSCVELGAPPAPGASPSPLRPPLSDDRLLVNRRVATAGAPSLRLAQDLLEQLRLESNRQRSNGAAARTRARWETATNARDRAAPRKHACVAARPLRRC